MSSSRIAHELGRCLNATEARGIADRLDDGDTLTVALKAVPADKRSEVRELLSGLGVSREHQCIVLRGIEGARSVLSNVSARWTMPGHMAQTAPLTTSAVELVARANQSVTCSTFNFQRSSGLWNGLKEASRRLGRHVRVYIDADAADKSHGWRNTTTTDDIAQWLFPATVLRTKVFDGRKVRNHAKFIVIDHRFVLATSANFSVSAEMNNVEFGLQADNPSLADRVERDMRAVEPHLYEQVVVDT